MEKNKKKLFRSAMLLIAAVVFTVSAVLVAGPAWAGPAPKVEICHIPPDNPSNFHTITVSSNALPAHLAHGDLGGACNNVCATLCDDQNACTIDDTGDCETAGCPTVPAPVDCNDGNLCTDDSCDSNSGCVNTEVVCDDPDLCTLNTCAPDTGECVTSPVSCPDGFTCDLGTGACEPDIPGDPCEGVVCDDGFTCIDGECIEGSAKNLLGPDTGTCDGAGVGYTTVVDLGAGGLRVDVEFSNGPANSSSTVYWVCTNVPGGCHGDACGYISLGTITRDSNGQGFLSTVLPAGNPYPGKYVHFDVGGAPWFTSFTHEEIFPVAGSSAALSTEGMSMVGGSGDPTE
jgi:hypothetical protein